MATATNGSTWNTFAKEATVTSSDFGDEERAHVPDGTYHARVERVGEPYDKANPTSGEMQTKFPLDLRLSGRRLKGETVTLPSFITLPPKFLDGGFLSEKSNLYKLMKSLGFDMTGKFVVDPPSWVDDELFCDVVVENNDQDVSWVTKFMVCSCEEGEEQPAKRQPAREPVAAGAGRSRSRKDEEWEED